MIYDLAPPNHPTLSVRSRGTAQSASREQLPRLPLRTGGSRRVRLRDPAQTQDRRRPRANRCRRTRRRHHLRTPPPHCTSCDSVLTWTNDETRYSRHCIGLIIAPPPTRSSNFTHRSMPRASTSSKSAVRSGHLSADASTRSHAPAVLCPSILAHNEKLAVLFVF